MTSAAPRFWPQLWPRLWHWLDTRFDGLAIGLSGLCAVHCVASVAFVALAASAGGLLLNPAIHEVGLTVAILIGAIALGRGFLTHGLMLPVAVGAFGLGMMAGAMQLGHDGGEALYTIIGVGVLALGHDLNRRAGWSHVHFRHAHI